MNSLQRSGMKMKNDDKCLKELMIIKYIKLAIK